MRSIYTESDNQSHGLSEGLDSEEILKFRVWAKFTLPVLNGSAN